MIVILASIFFGLAVLGLVSPRGLSFTVLLMMLVPAGVVQHLWIWTLLTYPFLNTGILGTVFALLTLWFTGAMLEDARGPRWFLELFYVSTIGGGLLATLLAAMPLLTAGHLQLRTSVRARRPSACRHHFSASWWPSRCFSAMWSSFCCSCCA